MTTLRLVFSLGQRCRAHRSCGDIYAFTSQLSREFATNLPSDKVTHTGQHWEEDDFRMARFVDKTKVVNENWAVKLIDSVPPTQTEDRVVSCDGGGGSTGHPKVYINLDKPGNHACGYCGLRFHKKENHH